jgi:UDP-glucuronate 4-epimerase
VSKDALVTGCAGFIGSHLSERLVADGWHVLGVDAFTPYYDRAEKEAALAGLRGSARFDLVELDLASADLAAVVRGAPVVFHLAAQPGVRTSFGDGFAHYTTDNIVATQRLLEAAQQAGCPRVVWGSSSSVYGDAADYPCAEERTPTRPRSPYGVTKRACEDLAAIYRSNRMCVVGLRYFTVYGPRQRPDMAIRRLCEALLDATPFPLYGDGGQSRDFTHVTDAVDATARAAAAEAPRSIYNVGGGEEATMADVVALLQEISGCRVVVDRRPAQRGDVRRTSADTTRARADLAWAPRVGLRDGLQSELDWVRARRAELVPRVNGTPASASGPVTAAPTLESATLPAAARTGAARS